MTEDQNMTETPTPTVRDDRGQHRFVLDHPGPPAFLDYTAQPGRLILVHTEVPEELAGRGYAGMLVEAALERARSEHLVVVPWCPFARRWLQKHEDAAAGIEVDWTTPRPPR